MARLRHTEISRGGVTAHYWYDQIKGVEAKADRAIELSFSIPSKGGGFTEISIKIAPGDFKTLLSLMVSADRYRAMKDMGAALTRLAAEQPDHDKRLAKRARAVVLELAREAHAKARPGDDKSERALLRGVRRLVKKAGIRDR